MQECRAGELDDGEVLCCDKIAKEKKLKKAKKARSGGGASAKETKNISKMRDKIQCSETKQRNVTNE